MNEVVPTEYLQYLKDRGILDNLYKMGLIGYKAFVMLEVRKKVDSLMRQGKSKGQAVVIVGRQMNMSRRNVYRYLPSPSPSVM